MSDRRIASSSAGWESQHGRTAAPVGASPHSPGRAGVGPGWSASARVWSPSADRSLPQASAGCVLGVTHGRRRSPATPGRLFIPKGCGRIATGGPPRSGGPPVANPRPMSCTPKGCRNRRGFPPPLRGGDPWGAVPFHGRLRLATASRLRRPAACAARGYDLAPLRGAAQRQRPWAQSSSAPVRRRDFFPPRMGRGSIAVGAAHGSARRAGPSTPAGCWLAASGATAAPLGRGGRLAIARRGVRPRLRRWVDTFNVPRPRQ